MEKKKKMGDKNGGQTTVSGKWGEMGDRPRFYTGNTHPASPRKPWSAPYFPQRLTQPFLASQKILIREETGIAVMAALHQVNR